MAAPTVAARAEYALTSAGTTATPTFTQTTGDRVVIFLSLALSGTISPGDGFTDLTNTSAQFHIIYKDLDGSEGGNVAITIPSGRACALAYNLTAGTFDPAQAPEFSTVATGTSSAPDSDSLIPTGGAKDYLWLSAFHQDGEEADDDTWVSSAPGAFSNLIQKTTGTAQGASSNSSIAAAERVLNQSNLNPGAFATAQSLAWLAYTVAIHPVAGNQLVTPGVATLTTVAFAPVIRLQVVPSTAGLALTTFAPSLALGVTPATLGLALLTFAPTVSATDHQLVVPDLATLALSTFAPTVSVSGGAGVTVTPSTAALTLAAFAPVVELAVVPGVASLTLTPFAPAVNLAVTPPVSALTLTTFVPQVRLSVIPGVAALTLATFAPVVGLTVTPAAAALVLTAFAPQIGLKVIPPVVALTLATFAPVVTGGAGLTLVPATAALSLVTFTPVVALTDHQVVTPGFLSLTLTPFAPTPIVPLPSIPFDALGRDRGRQLRYPWNHQRGLRQR